MRPYQINVHWRIETLQTEIQSSKTRYTAYYKQRDSSESTVANTHEYVSLKR